VAPICGNSMRSRSCGLQHPRQAVGESTADPAGRSVPTTQAGQHQCRHGGQDPPSGGHRFRAMGRRRRKPAEPSGNPGTSQSRRQGAPSPCGLMPAPAPRIAPGAPSRTERIDRTSSRAHGSSPAFDVEATARQTPAWSQSAVLACGFASGRPQTHGQEAGECQNS
jgi:hypothetical protein